MKVIKRDDELVQEYPDINVKNNRTIWNENGRDPDRIREICETLKEAWEQHPQERLGQFLLNYIFEKKNMFDQEDDITFKLIEVLSEEGKFFLRKEIL